MSRGGRGHEVDLSACIAAHAGRMMFDATKTRIRDTASAKT